MRSQIPNTITLVNLLCGCLALVCVFEHQFQLVFIFFFIGGLADYCDGFIARMLGVNSPFGKELDSLADMVTFGILPAAILYTLLIMPLENQAGIQLIGLPGFLIAAFAGVRLAKFNLDTRQADDFIGMPTPACATFIVGLMLIYHHNSFGLGSFVTNPYFLYPVIIGLSYLLISEIPMFSFKFKSNQWKGNERRIIFLLLSILVFILLKEVAFSLLITLYILFALFDNLFGFQKPTT